MATIEALPAPQTIWSFRGVLDFYCFRGVYCVRSWPRRPALPRSPAVQATAAAFASLGRRAQSLDPDVRAYYVDYNRATGYTWKDALVSAAYGNLNTW